MTELNSSAEASNLPVRYSCSAFSREDCAVAASARLGATTAAEGRLVSVVLCARADELIARQRIAHRTKNNIRRGRTWLGVNPVIAWLLYCELCSTQKCQDPTQAVFERSK